MAISSATHAAATKSAADGTGITLYLSVFVVTILTAMATLITHLTLPSGQTLALYHGDLTEAQVGAIVNAANEHLEHGGGLAGAIVRRGGKEIQAESNAWVRQHGLAGHDKPALTGAGQLPCQAIIHAVG